MNLIELILFIVLYCGFVHLSIPYALGEKFANLFKKKDCHNITMYACSNVNSFSTWQKYIRFLAAPGLFVGWLIRKIPEFVSYLISPKKTIKLIVMTVFIPLILAAVLYGLEQLDTYILDSLMQNWNKVIEGVPSNSFFLFGFFVSLANSANNEGFNLLLELLKLIACFPIQTFYFATIFGLFEATTVSLVKEDDEDEDDDDEDEDEENPRSREDRNKPTLKKLLLNCICAVVTFFKKARIPFTCRVKSSDSLQNANVSSCCYKDMNKLVFIISAFFIAILVFLWLCITGESKSFAATLWSFVLASGLLQAIVSFILTALANLATHKVYQQLPEGFREFVDEKLTDAVGGIIESNILSVSGVLNTPNWFNSGGSGTSGGSGSSDISKTHYFK